MRRYPFGVDGRNRPGRRGDVFVEQVREAVRAQGSSTRIEEQVLVRGRWPHVKPPLQYRPRFLPQWQFAFTAPLAQDADGFELGTG